MAKTKTGLGKGIDMLIPSGLDEPAESSEKDVVSLKISRIEPNRSQPRKQFDEGALNELAESVKQYGIIQPIVVCRKDDYYEIIAGERRWRAAKKAGLKEVPVVIKDYTEKEIMEISLIENIQREDLNPVEVALGYQQLINEYHLTQDDLAKKISKSRTAITNTLRLLKLQKEVLTMVSEGRISEGHARALLGLDDEKMQLQAAEQVAENHLSVRQTEDLVKAMNAAKPDTSGQKKIKNDAIYKNLEKQMTASLGTKVKISQKEKGKGKIEISYFSEEELDRIYKLLNRAGN